MGLDEVAARGYVVDEWARWQQGGCVDYAVALMRERPGLRLGVLFRDGVETHFFAHNDTHAYDSAGRHPLPYLGLVEPLADRAELDQDPSWYDPPDENEVQAAVEHIRRHDAGDLSRP